MKEHLPKTFSLLLSSDERQSKEALCGNKKNPIVINPWRDNDLSEEAICKSCRKKACEDCFGTGFQNGGSSGLYCHCHWGTVREFANTGL